MSKRFYQSIIVVLLFFSISGLLSTSYFAGLITSRIGFRFYEYDLYCNLIVLTISTVLLLIYFKRKKYWVALISIFLMNVTNGIALFSIYQAYIVKSIPFLYVDYIGNIHFIVNFIFGISLLLSSIRKNFWIRTYAVTLLIVIVLFQILEGFEAYLLIDIIAPLAPLSVILFILHFNQEKNKLRADAGIEVLDEA